jgi:cytochrome b561
MSNAVGAAPQGYQTSQIYLHWAVFLLVAFLFLTGDNMTDAFKAWLKSGGQAWNSIWIPIHMTCGLLVLGSMVLRIALRRRFGAPPPTGAALLRLLATGVHHLLYLLLILAPIGGLIGLFLFPGAAEIHHFLVRLPLMILVGLHVIGALWHRLVLHDGVLQRMFRRI